MEKGEKFCDMVDDMLKDTYYRFWKEGNLKWMDDYPQVMARIHYRVLEEAKSTAAGKGGTPFDLEAVRGKFSSEELDAISKGYDLIAQEDKEDNGGDEGDDIDWDDDDDGNAGNVLFLYFQHT